jgi:hypothetical protein
MRFNNIKSHGVSSASVTELMSPWSKWQSRSELMTRTILRSSTKIKTLQWLTELQRSLMNR